MAALQDETPLYDLYALVNHLGSTATSGHYTACCQVDNGWFHFNDYTVQPLAAHQVVTNDAYILFYKKRAASSTAKGV